MFTGIIEEMGVLKGIKHGAKSSVLTIAADKVLEGTKLGDSICTNGVCLTVTKLGSGTFDADVMAESIRRTNLGDLKSGDRVNLERALRLCDRLGGHIVSGHVEGIGVIAKCRQDGIANVVTVKTPPELMRYILHKGSIAIDGISLTVTDVTEDTFSVSLIPHTSKETTLGFKTVGDEVNLETDIIGKYVEQMLKFGNKAEKKDETSVLSKATLFENGFM